MILLLLFLSCSLISGNFITTNQSLYCVEPPAYLLSDTVITESNNYIECNCSTLFSADGLYKLFSFDGHTTVASIIPQNKIYQLDSVIYIETNRNGTPVSKIGESTFLEKETLIHYFDPDPITTSMEISTTRNNANGYPILIWVISAGDGV